MMNRKTSELIRDMLSTRAHALLTEIHSGRAVRQMVDEFDAVSAALVDFARNDREARADEHAVRALDTLLQGRKHLTDLDTYFKNGTGTGSAPHKFIGRLIQVAEDSLPDIDEAVVVPMIPTAVSNG